MKNKGDVYHSKNYLILNFIILFFYLILYPLATKYVEPDSYGKYIYFFTIFSIVSSFGSLGLKSIFRRNFFEINKLKDEVTDYMLTLQIFLIFVFICLFFGLVAINFYFNLFNFIFYILFIAIILDEICKFYLIYLENIKKSLTFFYLNIIKYSFFFLVTFILLINNFQEKSFIYSLFISNVVLFSIIWFKQNFFLKFNFKKKLLFDTLKLSLPSIPRALFGQIHSRVDKILLAHFSTFSSTGIYAIGQSISYVTFQIMNSLDKVFVPTLYKYLFDKKNNLIGGYLTPFIYFIALVSICVIILTNLFVDHFLDQKYQNTKIVILILSFYYFNLFFSKISGHQILFRKKVWINTNIFIFNVFLNILLSVPLIYVFDIIGAVIATFFSSLICTLISIYYAQKYAFFKYEKTKIAIIYLFILTSGTISYCLIDSDLNLLPQLIIGFFIILSYLIYGNIIKILNKKNIINILFIK